MACLQQPSLCGNSHQIFDLGLQTTNSTCFLTYCVRNTTENYPTVQRQLSSAPPWTSTASCWSMSTNHRIPGLTLLKFSNHPDWYAWKHLQIGITMTNVSTNTRYLLHDCLGLRHSHRNWHRLSAEDTQTITLIVHIKCKYCKIHPLPMTLRGTPNYQTFRIP